jgi:hypothetical protein
VEVVKVEARLGDILKAPIRSVTQGCQLQYNPTTPIETSRHLSSQNIIPDENDPPINA